MLRAPFGGTVVERRVEMGEYVAPGAPVAVLMDASELRSEVLLDPREALDVQPGARRDRVGLRAARRGLHGEVLRVGEAVDRATRRLPVEVVIDDPQRRLRPGSVGPLRGADGPPARRRHRRRRRVFERFEVS